MQCVKRHRRLYKPCMRVWIKSSLVSKLYQRVEHYLLKLCKKSLILMSKFMKFLLQPSR
ncbi:hypothetical protein D3C77_788370 [compost metagenome]